ncbi:daptide-type RiPP [Streptomyces sp. NPDC019990]
MNHVIDVQIEELESMQAPGWGEVFGGAYAGASAGALAVSIGIVLT